MIVSGSPFQGFSTGTFQFTVRVPDMTGWGENGRSWFDDEFWMDVLIQGVGWLLVAGSILVSARFFYKQRENELADRKHEARAARIGRSAGAVESLLSDIMDLADGFHRWDAKPGAVGDMLNMLASIRVKVNSLPSVAQRIPSFDFSSFALDVNRDVNGYTDEMMALAQRMRREHRETLTEADWDEVEVLTSVLGNVLMFAQGNLLKLENSGELLERKATRRVMSWPVALEKARTEARTTVNDADEPLAPPRR